VFRIGLDLRPTEPGFKSHFGRGTGRYAEELINQLLARDLLQLEFVSLKEKNIWDCSWEGTFRKYLKYGKTTLETQVFFPRRLKKLNLDLVHFFSHGDAPARNSVKQIVTVLDLIPLKFADLYKANKPSWRYHLARYFELKAIYASSGILAISEATKKDIIEILKIPSEQIFVTPLAADSRFVSRPQQNWKSELVERRKIFPKLAELDSEVPLLLYVGGIDPRKNIQFLLEVFAEVITNWDKEHKPVLALAGKIETDDQYPKLINSIERLNLTKQVKLLGFIDDSQLIQLYQSANCFLFPSLYEGFGLPVLEAMACGCPVIAGRNSSIPEVAGRAGILLNDGDGYAWSKAILEILNSFAMQNEYSLRGVQRSSEFSWANTATKTIEAYNLFLNK
jgi:glycosyltransferase involved in cell wall biosynthesis